VNGGEKGEDIRAERKQKICRMVGEDLRWGTTRQSRQWDPFASECV